MVPTRLLALTRVRDQFKRQVTLVVVGTFVLAVCIAESLTPDRTRETPTPSYVQASAPIPRIPLPVWAGETIEGLVEVNGHDIYARCKGRGSPTVVYFAGWGDRSKLAVSAIQGVEAAAAGKQRICSYERRNTGRSEQVKGTQSPEDIVADVDGVLEAMGEDGPFVLLGASFGGLVAGAYAAAHPDRTAGILLLDSSISDDYIIDKSHGFQGACPQTNRDADAHDSLEKIDNCRLAKWAYDRRDLNPAVPLIYLAANDPSDRGDVADDPARKAFVQRWSPGIWEPVSAPHWMEEADPDLVATHLERLIALANRPPWEWRASEPELAQLLGVALPLLGHLDVQVEVDRRAQ